MGLFKNAIFVELMETWQESVDFVTGVCETEWCLHSEDMLVKYI